jgi:hypothetical protein
MPPFLSLDAVAAKRGEGLRPELRALFERLATVQSYDAVARSDGMVQSGPNPASAKETFSQTPPLRKSNADSGKAPPVGPPAVKTIKPKSRTISELGSRMQVNSKLNVCSGRVGSRRGSGFE